MMGMLFLAMVLCSGLSTAQTTESNVKGYHVVPQDHFDVLNSEMWPQTYFVNDTFWKPGSNSPVFLCTGGEGPAMTTNVVRHSPHCNNAVEFLQETGALFLAVEHRYYTCHNMTACPVKSFRNNKDYKYLSAAQAIEDLAWFHRFASKKYHLTRSNRWITFGGSYPGMVTAFARIKYPHLFFAAVSSSAPVQAQYDMSCYNDVVAEAYSMKIVGGSKECTAMIAKGHRALGEMVRTDEGKSSVEKMLQLEPGSLKTEDDIANVLGGGVANFPAQSNDPSCTEDGCNIEKICRIMTARDEPVTALIELRKVQGFQATQLSRSLLNNWENFWNWQVCTEFGYLQSCEKGSKCMFTQGYVTADWMFRETCTKKFGFQDKGFTLQNIQNTLLRYSGNSTEDVERILWVNGEVDPWKCLSVTKLTEFQRNVLNVPGASHHAWTHPSDTITQPSVMEARNQIRAQILEWLQL